MGMPSFARTGVFFLCLCILGGGSLPSRADEPAAISELTLKTLKLRSIGPANPGGRITDIAVDPSNTAVIYVGEATGGLYKTKNGGTTWENVFAKQSVASVGAVAVAPSKPAVVWVGTGEANTRNSVSWGNGVYRSDDGGESWKHVGLATSKAIGRVLVDPSDPNIAWVAATGDPFGPGGERGVYKTTDGGKTWSASLVTDANTGAVDLAMHPKNPNVVFAAMWARQRNGYSFTQGSQSDGIYRTTDGGKSWERLARGLPPSMERVGLAIAPSDPNVVYAVVASSQYAGQTKAGGFFRSDDGGNTWKRRSGYDPRPFYFSQVRVDPKNSKRVYELNFFLGLSTDGGVTFRDTARETVHPDWHALWIDPRDPKHLVAGTDGGLYVSVDAAETWRMIRNMPTGEFYTVTYDYAQPYDVCGGLQDNNTWCGPHATNNREGITNRDWIAVLGGDGFYAAIDRNKPWIVWAEAQGGTAAREDLRTGKRTAVRPAPAEGTPAFRFNWNTPLVLDAFDTSVVYMGGNKLFKITDNGERVRAISPDLSKHVPGTTDTAGSSAENFGTITTVSQSSLDRNLFWVGTDDGNVQLTRDGGANWTNVTERLPAEVRNHWVRGIEASHFAPGRTYVASNGHYNDDFRPHLFATDDFGQTWKSIVNNLPADGPVNVVREDTYNQNLLFVGTEFGLFVSFDRGAKWLHLSNGLPTVAVDDIQIHPRDHDLIVATHGAALWILDDIEGLEELSALAERPLALFDMRPAFEVYAMETPSPSQDEFVAKNPPQGVIISYYVRSYTGDPVSVTIKNEYNRVVRKLEGSDYPGLNRIVWDMHPTPPGGEGGGGGGGFGLMQPPFVPPGTYTVTVSVGSTTASKKVKVGRYDPTWVGQRMH